MTELERAKMVSIRRVMGADPTTSSYWKQLIESRVKMIEPHLDVITLGSLGDEKFPFYWSAEHGPYSSDLRELDWHPDSKRHVKTQGIYFADWSWFYTNAVVIGAERKVTLWGFTRRKEWVSAELCCLICEDERKSRHDAIAHVSIDPIQVCPSSLDLLAQSPQGADFWEELGNIIINWHERIAKRFETTQSLAEIIKLENSFMQARQGS